MARRVFFSQIALIKAKLAANRMRAADMQEGAGGFRPSAQSLAYEVFSEEVPQCGPADVAL
jgi:hypothetical protein